jgi:hypothetical protein
MDQLMSYASNKNAAHLPAWQAFNRSVGSDGSVGIWHETYTIQDASQRDGAYETMYINMPAFGLGKAGLLEKAQGKRSTARGRLSAAATGN